MRLAVALAALVLLPPLSAVAQTRTAALARLSADAGYNALPQTARAVVNCRILPDHPAEDVQRTLAQVVGGPPITVTPLGEAFTSPPSPLDPDLLARVERITSEMWPGAVVIPTMSTGATGLFLSESRAHGRDERIGVKDLHAGRQFLHRLVTELAASPSP